LYGGPVWCQLDALAVWAGPGGSARQSGPSLVAVESTGLHSGGGRAARARRLPSD